MLGGIVKPTDSPFVAYTCDDLSKAPIDDNNIMLPQLPNIENQISILIRQYGVEACRKWFDKIVEETSYGPFDERGLGSAIITTESDKTLRASCSTSSMTDYTCFPSFCSETIRRTSSFSSDDEQNDAVVSQSDATCPQRSRFSTLFKKNDFEKSCDKNAMAIRSSLTLSCRTNDMLSAATKLAIKDEQRLKSAALDTVQDAVVCADQNGTILTVNSAAVDQFGFDCADQLLGKNVCVLAEFHDLSANDSERRVGNVADTTRELLARRRDGAEFPCVMDIKVVENESTKSISYITSIHDVSLEKEAQRLAQDVDRQIEIKAAILDASFDAMFAMDTHGYINSVNKATLKIFGYDSVHEILGQNFKVIVREEQADFQDVYSRLVGSQRKIMARRKDGTEFPAAIGIEHVEPEKGQGLFVAFVRDITAEERSLELEIEQRIAEKLLINMLPPEIIERLKQSTSQHLADHHNNVTILFADIVGFTAMSSEMAPADVVKLLNDLFTRFDNLVDKYGLNKVKTIGDCYMVTSVLVNSDYDKYTCASVCHFAFDMLMELEKYNELHPEQPLSLRIGINSGPVVAGVVGTKRYLYDLWGDAVNLASRMESTGVPGRIQVTQDVVDIIPGEEFSIEPRGLVDVKGKGSIKTFFLTESHPSREECAARSQSIRAFLEN